jgi:hypothetical protein
LDDGIGSEGLIFDKIKGLCCLMHREMEKEEEIGREREGSLARS